MNAKNNFHYLKITFALFEPLLLSMRTIKIPAGKLRLKEAEDPLSLNSATC